MNKMIRNTALTIPPLRRLYEEREQLRKQVEQLEDAVKQAKMQRVARILEQRVTCSSEFELSYNEILSMGQKYEEFLTERCIVSSQKSYAAPGFCEVCGEKRELHLDMLFSAGNQPCFRERMICPVCGLNSRMRYMAATIIRNYRPGLKTYLYEQITPLYRVLEKHMLADDITGSEFLSSELESGTIENGILHEDAECLSFNKDSFDQIVSCDVFEHVNDCQKCFQEAFRVLKPGGKLYMSVPFHPDRENSFKRAELKDGEVIYYAEPIYHGNPLSGEGSLCIWDFGWDIIEKLKCAGFGDVYIQFYYSLECAYLHGQHIFIATK